MPSNCTKVRMSNDPLTFIMEIPIPGKTVLILKLGQRNTLRQCDLWWLWTVEKPTWVNIVHWVYIPHGAPHMGICHVWLHLIRANIQNVDIQIEITCLSCYWINTYLCMRTSWYRNISYITGPYCERDSPHKRQLIDVFLIGPNKL